MNSKNIEQLFYGLEAGLFFLILIASFILTSNWLLTLTFTGFMSLLNKFGDR